MSLDSIVTVTITKETASLTQTGFALAMIAGYHTVWVGPEFTRTYNASDGLTAMVTDGFLATDPLVKAATAYLSSNPNVSEFKIGLLQTPPVYMSTITPVNTTEGFVYDFDIINHAGVSTNITLTVGATSSVLILTAALQTLIDAIAGITAVDNTTTVTISTDGVGEIAAVVNTHRPADLLTENLTADAGIAADLTALAAVDDVWYGLLLSSNGGAEVLSAMSYVEARTKLFVTNASDTECLDAGVTDDVISTAQDSAYVRSVIGFSENDFDYAGATLMGQQFPFQPGTQTWEYKTLAGVAVSDLTASELASINGKNGFTYTNVGGANVTRNVVTPGGEFPDVTHGIDELQARIQEAVFLVLLQNGKVPFTSAGIQQIVTPIQGVLDVRVDLGFLSPDPAPLATGPALSSVSAADKAARNLPNVTFTATLAGAVHTVVITGKVVV